MSALESKCFPNQQDLMKSSVQYIRDQNAVIHSGSCDLHVSCQVKCIHPLIHPLIPKCVSKWNLFVVRMKYDWWTHFLQLLLRGHTLLYEKDGNNKACKCIVPSRGFYVGEIKWTMPGRPIVNTQHPSWGIKCELDSENRKL